MTITYADSLSTQDGMSLMENFSASAGFERNVMLFLPGTRGPHFMGLQSRTMRGLVETLNPRLPANGMAGFAGRRILSLHFQPQAYGEFLGAMQAETAPAYTVQIADKPKIWHDVAQHWAGKRNHFELEGKGKIEVQAGPQGSNIVNYIFPDLTSLKEFCLRLRRATFDSYARNLQDGTFIPGRVYTLEPHTQPAPTAEKR